MNKIKLYFSAELNILAGELISILEEPHPEWLKVRHGNKSLSYQKIYL